MEENQTPVPCNVGEDTSSDLTAATFWCLTVSNQVLAVANHPLRRRSGRSVKARGLRRSCGRRGSRRGAASVHFCSLYSRCHLVTSSPSPVSVEPNHSAAINSLTNCLLKNNKWMSNNFLELNGEPERGPARWPWSKKKALTGIGPEY